MAFEDSAGINVSNFYGPRDSGGTEGTVKTEGVMNEYMEAPASTDQIGFGFPVTDGSAYVTECDVSQLTGVITAQTIGGVDISAATPEAPVQVPNANTGVVAMTGATAGTVLIKYKKYSKVA